MDIDAIGPLGPQPPPKGEKIETGRYPVLIEGEIGVEIDMPLVPEDVDEDDLELAEDDAE